MKKTWLWGSEYSSAQPETVGFLISLFLLFVIVITPWVSGVKLPEAEIIERVTQVQRLLWVHVLQQHGALDIKFTFLADSRQQLLQSNLRVHSQNCLLGPFIVYYQTHSSLRETDVIKLINEIQKKMEKQSLWVFSLNEMRHENG